MSTPPIRTDRDGHALAELNPMARALITTDGTLTPMLEQLVDEPIVTAHLTQAQTAADAHTVEGLCIEAGDRVLARTTELVGARTGMLFVRAKTMIRLEVLASELQEDLLITEHPIGKLLVRHRFESFRELLSWSVADPSHEPHTGAHLAERCYRIFHCRQPAFLISERLMPACFPV